MRVFGARNAALTIARAWLFVIGMIALGAGIALIYCLTRTPVYQAETTLYATSGSSEMPSTTYDNTKGSEERVSSYAKMVYSDAVLIPAREASGLDEGLDTLRSNVAASTVPGTTIIQITAQNTDKATAVRLADAVADSLTDSVARLEVPSGGRQPTTQLSVVTPATVDSSPVMPKTLVTVLLAALAGGVLGVLLALIFERLNRRVRDADDLAAVVGFGPSAELAIGSDTEDLALEPVIADLVQDFRKSGPQRVLIASLTDKGSAAVPVFGTGLADRLISGEARAVVVGGVGAEGSSSGPSISWNTLNTRVSGLTDLADAVSDRVADNDFVLVAGPPVVDAAGASGSTIFTAELAAVFDSVIVIVARRKDRPASLAAAVEQTDTARFRTVRYVLADVAKKPSGAEDVVDDEVDTEQKAKAATGSVVDSAIDHDATEIDESHSDKADLVTPDRSR